MAVFVFENATPAEAAQFDADDFLVFSSTSASATSVTVTPGGGNQIQSNIITITSGGKSLDFNAANLSDASQLSDPHIVFNDGTALRLGENGTDSVPIADVFSGGSNNDVMYGFGGDDSLNGGDGADYLYGGNGADQLLGGNGNDHLYGATLTTVQGAIDGNDSLDGGNGSDYLQGNGGDDSLSGGIGSDRIFGGGDNDTILGGRNADTVNGNRGNDNIDGGSGNDVLRGGQGNDTIFGGADAASVAAGGGSDSLAAESGGNDILYGDAGSDTLNGGTGFDVLFGGEGNDVFTIASGEAAVTNVTPTGTNIVEVIGDYLDGTDKIDFGGSLVAAPTTVTLDSTGTVFGTLRAALDYAQEIADRSAATNATEVVALNFGGDAYLFGTLGGGASIDTMVKVIGVTPAAFTTTDFI